LLALLLLLLLLLLGLLLPYLWCRFGHRILLKDNLRIGKCPACKYGTGSQNHLLCA
jgi:hypothetical protein